MGECVHVHTRAPMCPEHAQIETTRRLLRGRGRRPRAVESRLWKAHDRMGVSGWPPGSVHPALCTRSGRGTGPTSRNHQSDPAPAAGLRYGIHAPGPTSRHQGHQVGSISTPHPKRFLRWPFWGRGDPAPTRNPRPPGRASRDGPAAQAPPGPVPGMPGWGALTLWPFSPGSPARPSKPRSPCERTEGCSETVPLTMTARFPWAPGPCVWRPPARLPPHIPLSWVCLPGLLSPRHAQRHRERGAPEPQTGRPKPRDLPCLGDRGGAAARAPCRQARHCASHAASPAPRRSRTGRPMRPGPGQPSLLPGCHLEPGQRRAHGHEPQGRVT